MLALVTKSSCNLHLVFFLDSCRAGMFLAPEHDPEQIFPDEKLLRPSNLSQLIQLLLFLATTIMELLDRCLMMYVRREKNST